MLTLHLYQDSIAVYYKGRRIPTVALYTTPTLHYIQHVALYVAKRLTELGISAFRHPDAHAARVIEIACGGACRWSQDGEEIESLLEEAYYNHLADRVIAFTTTADSLIIPCIDRPLAKALVKRAREYAPDLTLIASEYGGDCAEVDYVHKPQPLEVSIPLGPASRAVLHTAIWAIDEGIAEAPAAPLLDARCNI